MIKIGKIEKTTNNGKTRLTSVIEIDGGKYPLWVEVDAKYADALCEDRSDAFAVGFIRMAIKFNHDIYFEMPMTDQLKDGIEHDFIDVVCQKQPELHRVKLIGPICQALKKTNLFWVQGCHVGLIHSLQLNAD